MQKIYFLCTGNSCRSQMAEGYGHTLLPRDQFEVKSAGIETHGLNPKAWQSWQKTAWTLASRLRI